MAFSPGLPLRPVVPPLGAAPLRRLDRQAVDDGPRRARTPVLARPEPGPEPVLRPSERPGLPPQGEVPVDDRPRGVLPRERPRRAPGAEEVEDGVGGEPPGPLRPVSATAGRRKDRLEDRPLGVGEVKRGGPGRRRYVDLGQPRRPQTAPDNPLLRQPLTYSRRPLDPRSGHYWPAGCDPDRSGGAPHPEAHADERLAAVWHNTLSGKVNRRAAQESSLLWTGPCYRRLEAPPPSTTLPIGFPSRRDRHRHVKLRCYRHTSGELKDIAFIRAVG